MMIEGKNAVTVQFVHTVKEVSTCEGSECRTGIGEQTVKQDQSTHTRRGCASRESETVPLRTDVKPSFAQMLLTPHSLFPSRGEERNSAVRRLIVQDRGSLQNGQGEIARIQVFFRLRNGQMSYRNP